MERECAAPKPEIGRSCDGDVGPWVAGFREHDTVVRVNDAALSLAPDCFDRYTFSTTVLRSIPSMDTVTISPKFQVVIPKDIRLRLKLRAGQKVQAIAYDDRIELVPIRPARQLKGFLKGIDTGVPREPDRT